MATQLPIHFEGNGLGDDGVGKGDAREQTTSSFLPLTTTPPEPPNQGQEDGRSEFSAENSLNPLVYKDVGGKDEIGRAHV